MAPTTMHIFALLLSLSVLAMVGMVAYVYWRLRHHLRPFGRPAPASRPGAEPTAPPQP